MAYHSVWGSAAPPGTYNWYTDGSPSIWTMHGFYRTFAGTPVESVAGARVWVTAASLAGASTATVRVFTVAGTPGTATLSEINSAFLAPIESKVINLTATGWNEVLFDTPIPVDEAELVYLAIQYGNDDGYLHCPDFGTTSFISAENGMGFCFASDADGRAVYKIGTGTPGWATGSAVYGLDIIFDDGEGAAPLPARWAAYSFEDGTGTTVADSSGNGRNLTVNVGNATDVAGHDTGRGLALVSGRFAQRAVSIPSGFTALTVEGWYRPDNLVDGESALIAGFFNSGYNQSTRFALWAQRGDFGTPNLAVGQYRVGGTLTGVYATTRPANDTWVHVALVWDGAEIVLYLDGAEAGSAAFAPGSAVWTDIDSFGVGGGFTDAEWDDLRVYTVALTPDQVLQAMDTPVGQEVDTTPPTVPTGLTITSITHNSATASWTASTDAVGVTGYEVFRDGTSVGTVGAGVVTFNLTGLSPSTEYDITVRARDAAANWSAQTSAVSFTTDAGPTSGGLWINHVAIEAPQNGTTSHTVSPSSGTVLAGTLFTPTAGNLLVCVVEGAVTSSTPTGWTLPTGGSAVNNTGLYVWHRDAAGGDSLSTTHNVSNYPVLFHFFEFYNGSEFVGSASDSGTSNGGTGPTLGGLSGTNLLMYAFGRGVSTTSGTGSVAWSFGEEIVDHVTWDPAGGGADGFQYSLSAAEDFTGTSSSSAATWTFSGGASASVAERLVFAINVVQEPSGDTEAPSVPTNVEVSVASTTATITWDASTDNVGVTSYEVSLDGTPVGTPTATMLHVSSLTPSTTYGVTVRARDSAANWSASTTEVEFTTLAATRLTIAEENALPGTDPAWWLSLGGAVGDTANVGFTRDFSYEVGTTVEFCCSGGGTELQIYRLGWYGGNGARLVDTVAVDPEIQAGPTTIASSNNGVKFSSWNINATWDIPPLATSGFYLGVYRNAADTNASWIPFVVRDAARASDIVYKTADATWMIAYNHYGGPSSVFGGGSFYGDSGSMGGAGITGRAHACSYHRPYVTRSGAPLTAWSNAELPMIRWIERMGYEVKYIGCMDLHESVDCLDGASIFMSNGHDEYWSTEMRDNVEAFRDAGGNLVFASGNEVFWRIRRDTTNPDTIWCFKDTMPGPGGHTAGTPMDPVSWTGTWKDTRWGSRRPENLTTGTDFRMNAMSSKTTTFLHTAGYADHPVWRNTALAAGTSQSVTGIVGFEADEMLPSQPSDATVVLASETYNIDDNRADDNGQNYTGDGTLTWGVVAQRYPSGAVVVGFGTVQWSWALDTQHDATNSSSGTNLSVQQMTYNLLQDLGADAASPHTGIVSTSPVALTNYGLAPAPVSAYGFEDGTDKSGNGHHLTMVGSPSATGGHTGRAARTGPTNRFEGPVGANTSLAEYTVMAWVKFNAVSGTYRSVLSDGSNFYFDFTDNGTTMRLYCYSGASGHPQGDLPYTTTSIIGEWLHVACTRNAAGVAKVFCNGLEVASGNGNAYNFASPNFEVGSNADGSAYRLDGLIDDLRLFDHALTADQIDEWSQIPVEETSLTTVTKTVTSAWAATARVTKSVSAAWSTRFTGLKQVSTSWTARMRVAVPVSSAWAAAVRVSKSVSTMWVSGGATFSVTKTQDARWATRVAVTKTAATSAWSARAQVTKSVTARWSSFGIVYTVTKTVDGGWSARIRVAGPVTTARWATQARLTKNVIARWQTFSDVPVGNEEPIVIVLTRRPGGRAARSISITRRRR